MMQELDEVDCSGKFVSLACALKELDDFLVQCELASPNLVGGKLFAEPISDDIQQHRFPSEAVKFQLSRHEDET